LLLWTLLLTWLCLETEQLVALLAGIHELTPSINPALLCLPFTLQLCCVQCPRTCSWRAASVDQSTAQHPSEGAARGLTCAGYKGSEHGVVLLQWALGVVAAVGCAVAVAVTVSHQLDAVCMQCMRC
jgi:hypothetical protein